MADITDEEQIEALKSWWSQNGTSTIVAIILAIGGVVGYQTWQNHVRDQGVAASAIYSQLLDAVGADTPFAEIDKEKKATAKFLAQQLETDYSSSSYAHFAALFMARLAVEDGDLKTAQKELKWALNHGLNSSLETIVRMRLARVQLAEGTTDDALATLEGIDPGEYRPSYDELKGDIYHAMGDNDKAREAYQRAMNALGEDGKRPILKMKLEQLEPPEVVVSDKAGAATGAPPAKTDVEKGTTTNQATTGDGTR